MNDLTPSPGLMCANCGTELRGEFCHTCGQSIKSVLQPVSHMLEDAGDLFFHLDERIVHTLPPLYAKPGFLTLEYFAGRRVRYIAPFRLMFVFCLLAFFFVHMAFDGLRIGGSDAAPEREAAAATDDAAALSAAKTPEEVRTLYAAQIRDLREMDDPDMQTLSRMGVSLNADVLRAVANARLAELKAPPLPPEAGKDKDGGDTDDVDLWLSAPSNVQIAWLPGALNQRLTTAVARLKSNIVQLRREGPQRAEAFHRIVGGFFSVLPQTMFFMVPVFALVLKLFYVFRRRLYMEHVIVALHSHAFLFISLLALMLLGFARVAIRPHVELAARGIALVQVAMWLWIPVYLLIMQKRVYRQGWPMTIVKYWLIGSIYFWLLLCALTVALVISLGH